MFSLDGTVKYWLYNKPVDMRKSFNGLSGIVTNGMCASLKSGDVYIFMNASRNMMKMLRQEEGGLVLYAIRLDMGRMKPAVRVPFPSKKKCHRLACVALFRIFILWRSRKYKLFVLL